MIDLAEDSMTNKLDVGLEQRSLTWVESGKTQIDRFIEALSTPNKRKQFITRKIY